ncbi:MAG: hypothetical protein J7L45_00360 [Candidatus Aenigmarchaeota archaeon]|nr:hypothetical protein [Candidatus Aenigmarchaeota archaeon]
MASTRFIITILLGVIFTLLILLTFPPIYARYVSEDMALKSAYSVTEKIISAINMISSENKFITMNVSISCSNCEISLFGDKRYVKTTAIYKPKIFLANDEVKSSFGLFTLDEFKAPKKIITCLNCQKKLIVMKNDTGIYVFEEGWSGEECGGPDEDCCDGKCEYGYSCKDDGKCHKCKRYCPPKKCSGGWLDFCSGKSCVTKESCISETDDVPTCTYKVPSYYLFGCTKKTCKAKCYVDCDRCG